MLHFLVKKFYFFVNKKKWSCQSKKKSFAHPPALGYLKDTVRISNLYIERFSRKAVHRLWKHRFEKKKVVLSLVYFTLINIRLLL